MIAEAFPAPGEWVCYRGNPTLDGRSRAKGRLTQPRLVWKHFVGSVETTFVASSGVGDAAIVVPTGEPTDPPAPVDSARWGLASPLGETGGRLQPTPRGTQVTYADVLPDVPGLEKLEFESGFSKPTVNGQWQSCVGWCFAWRRNQWEKVWETQPIDGLFQALPIVGDFDGDGSPEVALLPWSELLVVDARRGKIKDRCRFTAGRSYGFFGVYDLEGDGKSEFVVQADFAKHIDVLGYRDGKLALLWQREIELDISNPQKILRVLPDPAADVAGDGKLEVVANLYNETGDGCWHALVFDGMTGAVRADLPDEFVQGLADVEGDGVTELLTTRTNGSGIPDYGPVLVRSLKGGQPAVLWQDDRAGWATWDRPMPLHVNSAATFGQRDVLCRLVNGRATVVLRRRADETAPLGRPDLFSTGAEGAPTSRGVRDALAERTRLEVAAWSKDGFASGTSVSGPHLEAVALDATGALLARCSTAPGQQATLAVTSGRAEELGSKPGGVRPGTAVVASEADGPTVIAQGGEDELAAFRPPRGDEPPHERWRLRGRGQGENWPNTLGPVVGELSPGGRQLVYATAAPTGCARLAAAGLDGRKLWRHDFPDIPGTPPVWNTGGIILWQTGFFTNRQRQDVLVTVRRSMMHSEETYLLSGSDGKALWHRDRQLSNRGVGGTPFALADYDGDGLDDVASLHPSLLYLLKGSTGADLLAKDASWDAVPAKPIYWGLPVAGDFDGTGKASLFFATTRRSMTGLIRTDGSLVWWDALDHSTTGYPAVGDFDGDGRTEVLGLGYDVAVPGRDDGIRCYDAATGAIEWRLPLPANGTPGEAVSADLDSNGRDEAIFVLGKKLYCLGAGADGKAGRVEWDLDLPTSVGPPAIADVGGNGQASVLLVGADGYVYCVQNRS